MHDRARFLGFLAAASSLVISGIAQEPAQTRANAKAAETAKPVDEWEVARDEFAKHAEKLREEALQQIEPRSVAPSVVRSPARFVWKTDIGTLVFAVGEPGGRHTSSAWDPLWKKHYGGSDDLRPEARREFHPTVFIPGLNPFYVALPYNDVVKGTTKPEAPKVIPWFKGAFVREGRSVCQNHWVTIRNRRDNKSAYAQWSDCDPFGSEQSAYVFGNAKPKPNIRGGAGIMVSPAVRDYLNLASTDVTDWRFVNVEDVPEGPWRLYGANNPLAGAGAFPAVAPAAQ